MKKYSLVIMMLFTVIIFSLLYFKNIESTESNKRGYEYYSEIQGWLKLYTEPADWQTARMICHDEDAVLAAPINLSYKSALYKMMAIRNETVPSMYVAVQVNYPEGVFKYKDGKMILSVDPADVAALKLCLTYLAGESQAWVDCRQKHPFVCYLPEDSSREPSCGGVVGYELNERTGSCYKFHSQSKPWNDAHRTCLAEGAHLAIINSDAESQVLTDLFAMYPFEKLKGTNPHWGVLAVGFYYWQRADSYVTIHGQTLEEAGYARWSQGNPSSRGKSKELGGGMFRSGLLDDVDKSYAVPFICEMEPVRNHFEISHSLL